MEADGQRMKERGERRREREGERWKHMDRE